MCRADSGSVSMVIQNQLDFTSITAYPNINITMSPKCHFKGSMAGAYTAIAIAGSTAIWSLTQYYRPVNRH